MGGIEGGVEGGRKEEKDFDKQNSHGQLSIIVFFLFFFFIVYTGK